MSWRSRRVFLQSSAALASGALIQNRAFGSMNSPLSFTSETQTLSAQIDASKIGEPISPYLYGMFIEHLGPLIYRGFWSEIVDDRKFYFPINSLADPILTVGDNGRGRVRRWFPVGPDTAVSMDKEAPYVGEQSPKIDLDLTGPRGIKQAGLGLRKGMVYNGHLQLKASPGTKILVSVLWGPGEAERQSVVIATAHTSYTRIPLKFTAGADTLNASLQITGTGTGSFHLGAISLMPADNIRGFRADTTRLLKQLNSGMYRLPGGNFLSDHDWRNAIGDPDKRPPIWDYHWKAMQPNDVGIDEFMALCKLLEVDPYVTVNAGLGDDRSAAELVEYANGSIHTPQGAIRAANGHPEPYGIKYWNVGNEPYGWWQIGHTALRFYVLKHNLFAKSMRKVDPSIVVIASGAMPDEMTVTGNARLATGKVQAEFGTEGDWTGGLLANCWGNFDGLSEHWYAHSGKRFDPNVSKDDPFKNGTTIQPTQFGFVDVKEPMLDWMRRPSNRVRLKTEGWEEYERRFPAMKDKKIFLSIDEWSFGRPDLKMALSYGMVMHEMFRHTDFMKMAAFTFATTCMDFDSNAAVLNSNGTMFKFYRDHFGTLPVEVGGDSPQPPPKWPVGGDQPRVSPGSPTYPLDMVAAFSKDRKFLTVSVINPTELDQSLNLSIQGVHLRGNSKIFQLTGPNFEAVNRLGQEPMVKVIENATADVPKSLSIARMSIVIYEFPVV